MRYSTYNAWRQGYSTPTTYDDIQAKKALKALAGDQVAKEMVGLKLLQDGILPEKTFNILMMRNMIDYL